MARAKAPRRKPPQAVSRRLLGFCGLSFAAALYVGIDYLRYLSPTWHDRLQPVLWAALALAAAARAPFYRHWDVELRAVLPFLGSIVFMLGAFLIEMISVRFVSVLMGLQWHGLVSLGTEEGASSLAHALAFSAVWTRIAMDLGEIWFVLLFLVLVLVYDA